MTYEPSIPMVAPVNDQGYGRYDQQYETFRKPAKPQDLKAQWDMDTDTDFLPWKIMAEQALNTIADDVNGGFAGMSRP